jgi:hypothetical protein
MAQIVLNWTPQCDMAIYLFASVVLCEIFMVDCTSLISLDQDPDATSACVSCWDKTLIKWAMSGWMIVRGKSSHRNRALTKDACPRMCSWIRAESLTLKFLRPYNYGDLGSLGSSMNTWGSFTVASDSTMQWYSLRINLHIVILLNDTICCCW